MVRTKNKILSYIIFSVAAIYLVMDIYCGINTYDEAVGLMAALRISFGEIPYQDFWAIYPPGWFYILSSYLSLLDWYILAERVLTNAIMFGLATMFYFRIKKWANNTLGLTAFMMVIVWAAMIPMYAKPQPLALVTVVASIFAMFRYFNQHQKHWLLIAGLATGAASLLKLDLAAYTAIAQLIIVIIFEINRSKEVACNSLSCLSNILVMYIIGILISFAQAAIYLLTSVDINILYDQLIYVPLNVIPEVHSLPLPNPAIAFSSGTTSTGLMQFWKGIFFYFPLFVFLSGLFVGLSGKKFGIKGNLNPKKWEFLLLSVSGILLYSHALVRSDLEHLMPAVFLSILLLFPLLDVLLKQSIRNISLIIIVAFYTLFPIAENLQEFYKCKTVETVELSSPRGRYIQINKVWGEDYNKTIDFLRDSTNDSPVFIGNMRHDSIETNDMMLYYLSNKRPPTRYHELHPGVATEDNVQRGIIQEMQITDVKWLVLVNYALFETQPSCVLDKYLRKEYHLYKKYGRYFIYSKR